MKHELLPPAGKTLISIGKWRLLADHRTLMVTIFLLALTLVSIVLSISLGSAKLTSWHVLQTLLGQGDRVSELMVFKVRLPRTIAVLVAGCALGLSGCLIQSLVRNRLATPDMVGVNEGAMLAIIFFTLYITLGQWPWWAAPLGALATAVLLFGLCRNPGEQGYLFVVVGIGVTEMLNAAGEFLMSTESIVHISSVYMWSMGNFSGQGYLTAVPVASILLCLLPIVIYLSRSLDVMRLGTITASNLGVHIVRVQGGVLFIAIMIAALGTAIGGPIAFIAMAAPIIASYLVGHRTLPLWCAALLGAVFLLLSDTLARVLAQPYEISTGVITRILGGIFLLFLLLNDKGKVD